MPNKIKIIIISMILSCFWYNDYSQYLFASNIAEEELFKTKDFSIYVDIREWDLVEQKKFYPGEGPTYIEIDFGNALSNPIIGKGSERVLKYLEEELKFKNNKMKIDLTAGCWPVGLWEGKDKSKEELVDMHRDAFLLLADSPLINIKNCEISYSQGKIKNNLFFYVSYVSDGKTSYGFINYTTRVIGIYFSYDLRKAYWFRASYFDAQRPMEIDILENYLKDFLEGFEPTNTNINEDQALLDYAICSADSLFMALQYRNIIEEKERQPLSIYKVPINIKRDGEIERRFLKDDLLDIREHPIQERIIETIGLLKDTSRKYFYEPRIYYALGLLYEFNALGERYGEGFNKQSAKEAYQNALSIDPKFSPARYNLTILYLRDGDLEKGINELKKLKEDVEVCCALGYAYEKKGDFISAINYYKLALDNFTAKEKRAAPDSFKHINEKIKQLKRY